jgi:hypothetical protein
MNKLLISCVVAASVFGFAQGAAAVTMGLSGAYWDTGGLRSLTAAKAASTGTATATFLSTAVDYPAGGTLVVSDNTKIVDFLGVDGASLSGSQNTKLFGSVFRFTGFIYLDAGENTFNVGSDDGFELTVGESTVRHEYTRGFGTTSLTDLFDGGWSPIDLMYFENGGNTGVELRLNGAIVTSLSTRTSDVALSAAVVPLPGAMPLLLGAMVGAGFLARRRKTA